MQTSEVKVLARLTQAARDGKLDGLQIESWVGGGQPPPFYRSEQFRLLLKDGRSLMEFAVLRFPDALTPKEVTEKHTLAADPADVRAVAGQMLETKVFELKFPEETNPGIASVISHEIIATADGTAVKRVYYRRLPAALEPLEKLLKGLIDRTREKGRHTWHHDGREIGNPFPKKNG
jgi:hypothetical protein